MIGTFQGFELTFGSFGQQYTTIDGQRYVTWFDLTDRRLGGLAPGAQIEYEATEGPTILCHSPQILVELPSAVLVRVRRAGGSALQTTREAT